MPCFAMEKREGYQDSKNYKEKLKSEDNKAERIEENEKN